MKRSTSFLAVLMFSAFVPVLLVNSPPANAGGGNCQDKLVGKSYTCAVEYSGGSSGVECFEFETGGLSSDFDLHRGVIDYGCTCQAQGSSFDASGSAFECAADRLGFGYELTGKLKKNKFSGQANTSDGNAAVFKCTETATPCP